MKTNFKFKTFLVAFTILAGLVFIPLYFVTADSDVSLYVTPSSGNYNIGDSINVSVKVNTKGETINAVKATLSFNENLKVKSISKSGSILGLWIEDPFYDNSSRIITFGGAGAGTTYKGSAGKIISIIFEAKKAGQGTINFSSNSVKYGATTIEVDSAIGGSYTITSPCNCGDWSAWQDRSCGGGNCSSTQRLQIRTRSCTPSGCKSKNEYRCKDDPGCISRISAVEIDVVPPVITLIGSITVNLYVGSTYEDAGSTAIDNVDGNITEDIVVVNPVDTTTAGTYIITYNVSDVAGNPAEEVTRNVKVEEKEETSTSKSLLVASLAIVWGEITQSVFLIIIVISCLIGLILIGIREWRLFQKKRKNSE